MRKKPGIPRAGGRPGLSFVFRLRYRYREKMRVSTLRFSNLPFLVLLSAIGLDCPKPAALILSPSDAPLSRRYFFTAAARLSGRARVGFAFPVLSRCPSP